MTKEDAYNLVNARYTLCRRKKEKINLARFSNLAGLEVLLNGGVLLLTIGNMVDNTPNFYSSNPEIAVAVHSVATIGAGYLSKLCNKKYKSYHEQLDDEVLALESLNSEICNGTNRFRNVEIEDFDEHVMEYVKTANKK